jgi:1,2-phenylacetyl-CoA epoxidase catalytic subunit
MSAVASDAATACLASLVGSLADNKAALGRRYGEWAVSAPTLESAVAGAAMAQDELGHARATFPLLGHLGAERHVEGDRHLALLDAELPDWQAFVAANLLVDGMLTTFVAACRASAFEPLAARARKILQEEGSHRVHAEAWGRRLLRGRHRDALLRRIGETWEEASRWPGPDDDAGFAAALEAGLVSEGPAAQRERVRAWAVNLAAGEGVELTLPEPEDWSRWDATRRRLT